MLLPRRPSSSWRPHGQISKSRRMRPRNMPERDDRALREALTNEPRREREVIVLHEDQRRVAVRLVARRPRRIARSPPRTSRSRRTGRPAGRARGGTAATDLRSQTRSSSLAPRRRSARRAGAGTSDWRAARPARRASRRPPGRRFRRHVPPTRRSRRWISGSSAVTSPPADRLTTMLPPGSRSCLKGSRLASTTIDSPSNSVSSERCRRSAVQTGRVSVSRAAGISPPCWGLCTGRVDNAGAAARTIRSTGETGRVLRGSVPGAWLGQLGANSLLHSRCLPCLPDASRPAGRGNLNEGVA